MSLTGLHERLTALQESTGQLQALIDRLADLDFQPGSVPLGTDEEDSVSGELSAEIGQRLKAGAEEQELLREEANYLRPEGHEKERLVDGVVRVGAELVKYRQAFRKARLQAKKSLVEAQKLERQLILKSYSAPVPEFEPRTDNDDDNDDTTAAAALTQQQQQQAHLDARHHQPRSIHQSRSGLSEEDQRTVGASSNVTASLRRAHDLIASELGRSEYAHQTLTESSAALRQLDDSYGSLDSMLGKSRELLGTLLRSQKSDTWYLQTAFYMLAVTAAWLVFRRLLYGPLWWLVLLPLRILFGAGSAATRAVLPAGGKSVPAAAPQAGQGGVGDVATDQAPAVQGIPDGSLPTVKVGEQDGRTASDGEITEAVEEAVQQAVEEAADAAEQSSSNKSAEEPPTTDGEPETEGRDGQGDQVNLEEQPRHAKDEL
ncbi:Sec20 domain-containing protein [Cordyceps javanica]|uniref:Sec20 domain-containing protein n=1 Tax=Cordyceps javanica TaxID=43265 RepID=A0A545W344_9HYPO|nr:Sec20 domain-containing protein [Cordyceps javanica]TQW08402.1 Sec20 domain protein [Cordyceps javanica]